MSHFGREPIQPQVDARFRYGRGDPPPRGYADAIKHNRFSAGDWGYYFRLTSGGVPFKIDGVPTWRYAIQYGNVSVFVLALKRLCELAGALNEEHEIEIARAITAGTEFDIHAIPFRGDKFDSREHFRFASEL